MKKASDLYHIPYSSFREWCYGLRATRKRGPPTILSPDEEKQLADYCIRMCEMGQGLTPSALKLKVYDITKSRATPFRDGIPGSGWMRWWKHRHPELTLRVSQALETARARGLCAANIQSFYENLQSLLTLHEYGADRIWNCDESGAQAGRNGGGVVIARKGARHVHSIVPDQRDWLSVLVCINADGFSIPSFYVFRGTRFRQNYIEKCEPGATMAMQPRAWMTTYLFSAWLSHFIESVKGMGGISTERRHLLILDGHNSHCTLEVVREARAAGLDILTLPAHTSHALQPLDVSVFKSFKQHFRAYRDFWTSRNLSQPATKSTLAHWVHLALRKALTKDNIKSGFRATGIYPVNPAALNSYLAPSEIFATSTDAAAAGNPSENHQASQVNNGTAEHENDGMQEPDEPILESNFPVDEARSLEMEIEFAEIPDSSASHFFVTPELGDCEEGAAQIASIDNAEGEPESITRFLTLPTITTRACSRSRDPLLDFTKSKILTSDEYTAAVERLNDAKESAAREKERLRTEKDALRQRKAAEKEACAIELAEARARRLQEKEEAARVKAMRAAEAAAVRAAKAAEKASRTSRRGGTATEVAQGHQVRRVEAETTQVMSEAQAPLQDFSFDAGGIANPYFSYSPASPGMQHLCFLPLNQLGNRVLSMSPNPQPQPILQPPPLQHTPHIFFPQGWAPTDWGGGEGRIRDGGREVRAGRSR